MDTSKSFVDLPGNDKIILFPDPVDVKESSWIKKMNRKPRSGAGDRFVYDGDLVFDEITGPGGLALSLRLGGAMYLPLWPLKKGPDFSD
tara:strand:- start:203 stop:469 length:267 start_codon:yes stop_codon:yes gene_type:complete